MWDILKMRLFQYHKETIMALSDTIELTPGSAIEILNSEGKTIIVTAPKATPVETGTSLMAATESQLIERLTSLKFGYRYQIPSPGIKQLIKRV